MSHQPGRHSGPLEVGRSPRRWGAAPGGGAQPLEVGRSPRRWGAAPWAVGDKTPAPARRRRQAASGGAGLAPHRDQSVLVADAHRVAT